MGSFGRGYGYRFDVSGYFPRAIKTLCLICVGVFLLQELSEFFFHQQGANFWLLYFGLVPRFVTHGFIWQPFTYLFLHAGILHILLNLLYLAMFGADLEHTWGAKRFYIYFFLCGVGAGVIDVIVRTIIDPHGLGSALVPTIGASGAIYGILLAAAVVMPHRQIWVFPLPVTVSMRVFVIVMGAIEFFRHHRRERRQRQPRLPPRRNARRLRVSSPGVFPLQTTGIIFQTGSAAA